MQRIYVAIIRGLMRFFALFPLGFHYFWADVIAWILEHVIHYRESVVYINLARSFPEKKPWEIQSIAHDFYSHMAEIIVESIWFSGSTPERLRKSHIIEMEHPEVAEYAFRHSPSVTVLTSHCGNWELVGGFPFYNYDEGVENPFQTDQTYVVYRRLKNPVWNEVFRLNRMAPLVGYNGQLESAQVLRFCIRNRDQKAMYCFIADQYPYMTPHPIGSFMSQPTMAMAGSVGVARKLGHSVIYMNIRREARGHYRMSFSGICDDASAETTDSILRKYYDMLEEDIRKLPANWLWTHRRWK